MNKNVDARIKKLTLLALFTAIVIVLQMLGQFIRFGMFSISLVLVPIVIGSALCGPSAGAYLGGVFGLAVLLTGDAAAFMTVNPLGTIITVMAKGILAGLISGLVYKAIEKKSTFGAVMAAAIVCPIVNTGVFAIGCFLFFMDYANSISGEMGYSNGGQLILLYFIGLNFVVEFAVNVVLVGVINRLIFIGSKMLGKLSSNSNKDKQ